MGSIRELRYVIPMSTFMFQTQLSLDSAVRAVLETLGKRHHTPQKLAERVGIILELAEGGSNPAVADRLGLHPASIRKWRERWLKSQGRLTAAMSDPRVLTSVVTEILSDNPRSGGPPTFTPEQVAAVVALACEPPEKNGVPVSEWSNVLLAEEAVRRGVVEAISPATVGRFLKSSRPQASQGKTLANQARRRSGGFRGASQRP